MNILWGVMLLGVVPQMVMGNPNEYHTETTEPDLSIKLTQSGQIHLESSAAPVARVLAELSKTTGIPISSRYNSMEPITKVCSGDSVTPILHCLLGNDADLIIRHGGGSRSSAPAKIRSVGILASTFLKSGEANETHGSDTRMSHKPEPANDSLTEVSVMIQSSHPTARAIGLERLGAMKGVAESTKREAFLAGLKDDEADVRAEAVTGLAMLGGKYQDEILNTAMHDIDPAVRLAAVDAMDTSNDSRTALFKALSDSDESVRELAAMRLGLQP